MEHSLEPPKIREFPAWAALLAGLVPLLVYVLSAANASYWLDSAEFGAAAVDLDIPHPPGHPLAQLWARLFCYVPVGSLPYRVALAQAVAAAIGCSALQLAFARTFKACGLLDVLPRALSALFATWLVAFSYGYWFQAIRAEVYALQGMLLCLALERLVYIACSDGERDVRPLYVACFYLGLGLSNHHFMAVLAMPALLHAAWVAHRDQGLRALGTSCICGAVGLINYLYLPLRAATWPPMDLGHPTTWQSFWWVVSAQVYARRIGTGATQPMGERFADLIVLLVEQFSLLPLLLAPLGIYMLARTSSLRPIGFVWGITALISLAGRAWLNPVRSNPDVLGYMLPGFAAYVVLAASAPWALRHLLGSEAARRPLSWLFTAILCGLAALQLVGSWPSTSLANFRATRSFQAARSASLAPHAVVFMTTPESTFLHWEAESMEHVRPDVRMVPAIFINYGNMMGGLLERAPELRESVRALQWEEGALSPPNALLKLARTRPVYVEADGTTSLDLVQNLLPEGLLYRVVTSAPTHAQLLAAAGERTLLLTRMTRELGADLRGSETLRQLLWIYFTDALYFATHQEKQLALDAITRGLELAPKTPQLLTLRRALAQPGRFDLKAFLPAMANAQ